MTCGGCSNAVKKALEKNSEGNEFILVSCVQVNLLPWPFRDHLTEHPVRHVLLSSVVQLSYYQVRYRSAKPYGPN
jgi:hypothetical protein